LIGLLIRLAEYPEVYFIGHGEYKPTGNTTSKGKMKNKKTKKLKCSCATSTKAQMDLILHEVRQQRKDINDLKQFMNKSKGTISVLMFLAGFIGVFIWGWNYIK
jgi:hypothetical protein